MQALARAHPVPSPTSPSPPPWKREAKRQEAEACLARAIRLCAGDGRKLAAMGMRLTLLGMSYLATAAFDAAIDAGHHDAGWLIRTTKRWRCGLPARRSR